MSISSLLNELYLPPPNKLIPQHFELLSPPLSDQLSTKEKLAILNSHPSVLINNNKFKIYYKLDRYFNQPKVYFVMNYAIKQETYTVDTIIKFKLFISCYLDSINEYLYDARLAGMYIVVYLYLRIYVQMLL